jgi:hypothetical protein
MAESCPEIATASGQVANYRKRRLQSGLEFVVSVRKAKAVSPDVGDP